MPERADSCAAWDEELSALIDGELAPEREAALRAHLEGCSRCAGRLAALRRVDERLAAAPLPEIRPALHRALLERVNAAAGPARRAAPRRALSFSWLAAPLAAAAALALYLALRPAPPAGPPGLPIARERPAEAEAIPAEPVEPAPTRVAEPRPPAPPPEMPGPVPEPAPAGELLAAAPPEPALEEEPAEDLAVVLFGAESAEDFDVIANLEILEHLLALEGGRG